MKNTDKALVTRQTEDTLIIAEHLARSGFFSDAREISQAVAKILAGQELGFGPVASMTGINIIQNKISLSANILGAAIKRHPAYNYRVKVHTDEVCTIVFFEQGEEVGVSTFTMQDAKSAGLSSRDNWRKYPRNMLFARAMSNGARWHCPDVGAGLYVPDELGATIDGEGNIIPGQYTVEGDSEPEVIVTRESVQWALSRRVNGGDKFMCQANSGNLAYIRQNPSEYSESVREAAIILMHEDAAGIRADLEKWEADLLAAIELGEFESEQIEKPSD